MFVVQPGCRDKGHGSVVDLAEFERDFDKQHGESGVSFFVIQHGVARCVAGEGFACTQCVSHLYESVLFASSLWAHGLGRGVFIRLVCMQSVSMKNLWRSENL